MRSQLTSALYDASHNASVLSEETATNLRSATEHVDTIANSTYYDEERYGLDKELAQRADSTKSMLSGYLRQSQVRR